MVNSPLVRLFLAGPLPEKLERALLARLEPLRRAAPQVRWVLGGQVHLTLAFLGEVGEPSLPSLLDSLRPVAGRHRVLTLAVQGVGCFGRPRRPNVLYADIAGDRPGLAALAGEIRSALGGWLPRPEGGEKPFHPHLTLARARGRHGDPSLLRCQSVLADLDLGTFPLQRLILFHSRLLSTGASHTELAAFPLGAAVPRPA
jgi:RNA 2',3'-cyclic 3'-phosphodiesterase